MHYQNWLFKGKLRLGFSTSFQVTVNLFYFII